MEIRIDADRKIFLINYTIETATPPGLFPGEYFSITDNMHKNEQKTHFPVMKILSDKSP